MYYFIEAQHHYVSFFLLFLICFRVAQAYVNQRKLDHEVKTLQIQAAQFSKQTTQWIGLVENFNQALKVRTLVVCMT